MAPPSRLSRCAAGAVRQDGVRAPPPSPFSSRSRRARHLATARAVYRAQRCLSLTKVVGLPLLLVAAGVAMAVRAAVAEPAHRTSPNAYVEAPGGPEPACDLARCTYLGDCALDGACYRPLGGDADGGGPHPNF